MNRFLIVDDHPLFREALESAVRLAYADADILQATSIDGAIDMIAAHRDFDLVLLDLSLPGTTGFSGLLRVRAAYPKLPVLVVSGHEDAAVVHEALSLGIAGYVPKSTTRKELAFAIQEALKGSVYTPKTFAPPKSAERGRAGDNDIMTRLRDLSPQQLLVLEMIRTGLQNKQIAHQLGIAETTVKAHVSEILRKLKVLSRTQAVVEVSKVDFATLRRP